MRSHEKRIARAMSRKDSTDPAEPYEPPKTQNRGRLKLQPKEQKKVISTSINNTEFHKLCSCLLAFQVSWFDKRPLKSSLDQLCIVLSQQFFQRSVNPCPRLGLTYRENCSLLSMSLNTIYSSCLKYSENSPSVGG